MPRILHDAPRMPLRADHDVRALCRHRLEEPRSLLRVDVEVSVEEHHELARGRLEAGPQRGALPAVLFAEDRAHDDMLVLRLRSARELRRRAVRRPVVDWNELRAERVGVEELGGARDVRGDLRCEVVDGHDDGEAARTDRLPRYRPLLPELRSAFRRHWRRLYHKLRRRNDRRDAKPRPSVSFACRGGLTS